MLKLKTCKVYFDTEFTGLTKNTDLISIGMVVLNRKTLKWAALYHEFTDYDKSKVNDWVKENVINNLLGEKGYHSTLIDVTNSIGTKEDFKKVFDEWIHREAGLEAEDKVCLVSDCSSYDHVLFNDIYGGAFQVPSYIIPQVYDIVHNIANFLYHDWDKAFDVSREKLCDTLWNLASARAELLKSIIYERANMSHDMKHNSLYDALTIAQLYNCLKLWEYH